MPMHSVVVIKPKTAGNPRTAAIFFDAPLYVVHFRNDGRRTRATDGAPYEYRTKAEDAALATAHQFVAYAERF